MKDGDNEAWAETHCKTNGFTEILEGWWWKCEMIADIKWGS